jgi:glycoprotein 6-alpha-L-fucosyltransferase
MFPSVPLDLLPRLEKLYTNPLVWWTGQLKKYAMRLLPDTQKKVTENFKKFGFRHPIVGVHLRRTDKSSEAKFYGIEDFMFYVDEYYDRLELRDQVVEKRRVYLATDESEMIAEARMKFPDYEIIANEQASKEANTNTRYSESSLIGIISDFQILSECDYVVCTFSSNIGRMVYELMQTKRVDASDCIKTIDNYYKNWGPPALATKALMGHRTDDPEQLEIEAGDTLEINEEIRRDGFVFATNRRTQKRGLVPAYKLEVF